VGAVNANERGSETETVVAVVCLVIRIGIGRWTKRGMRTSAEETQRLHDARMALRANPANAEPDDPTYGRPPQDISH
jgi:hypothetical protein